jgi:hypothetical protein
MTRGFFEALQQWQSDQSTGTRMVTIQLGDYGNNNSEKVTIQCPSLQLYRTVKNESELNNIKVLDVIENNITHWSAIIKNQETLKNELTKGGE